jgi:hypothetical protein
MRFLEWLSPQWAETLIRWLTFGGFSLISPTRWLTETALSPYVNLKSPSDWLSLTDQIHQLSPEILKFKLLPMMVVCLAVNVAYILLSQKLSRQIGQFLKPWISQDPTP